jgi:hypothetical protein
MRGWDDPEGDEDGADDPDAERAPICPVCGVTALPAEGGHGAELTFVCENPGCDAYGDAV